MRSDLETRLNEARTLHRQGRADLAVPVYEAILEEQPDHPEALHLSGVARLQSGDAAGAEAILVRAVDLAPENPKAVNNLGAALSRQGRQEEAAAQFEKAIALDDRFTEAHFNLGQALQARSLWSSAIASYQRAIELEPRHAGAHNNLGTVLLINGHFARAAEIYRAATRLQPDMPQPLGNLVSALELMNKIDEATAVGERLAELAPDMPAVRVLRARVARREGRFEDARDELLSVLPEADKPGVRYPALHELALVLDRLGDYSGAFAAARDSNELQQTLPDAMRWNMTEIPAQIAKYREWFTAERMASAPPAPPAPSGGIGAPVFFVGFPRSGTTLMEQILASHPALVTTGENSPLSPLFTETKEAIGRQAQWPEDLPALTSDETAVLRELFLEKACAVTGSDLSTQRLVDKMPMNIIHLGFIDWMFPESKIVVAIRDPRDVCLSCYMQQFAHNVGMVQFLDLERTGRLYAEVMGLWLHYRNVLGIPWIEYRYEDLTGDFNGTVRRVLDFIGAGWDDSVQQYAVRARQRNITTPSYDSVTQGITRRAVGRWRNYERELAPILPVLEPFVKEFGYEPS